MRLREHCCWSGRSIGKRGHPTRFWSRSVSPPLLVLVEHRPQNGVQCRNITLLWTRLADRRLEGLIFKPLSRIDSMFKSGDVWKVQPLVPCFRCLKTSMKRDQQTEQSTNHTIDPAIQQHHASENLSKWMNVMHCNNLFSSVKFRSVLFCFVQLYFRPCPISQAADGATPPAVSTATVQVTVQDVNDNSPVFSQESYVGYLDEKSPAATIVSHWLGCLALGSRHSIAWSGALSSLISLLGG